jgi:putative ABC transport system ATP-binding protein
MSVDKIDLPREVFLKPEENKHPLLELNKVTKDYATGDRPFRALNDINLEVFEGEFLGITGKSGAGKTTLLNMISGVSDITSGEVLFHNRDQIPNSGYSKYFSIHSLSEDDLAVWRGINLGIVYQSFELMPTLSLIENVMLPQDFIGSYHPTASKEQALELLDLVDIAEHAHKIPAHISGGQKQRVAIARALVNDPPLIIADEPTGNLDTVTAQTIFEIFEDLAEQGKTVIMVTHDESLANRFSRQIKISDGKLIDHSARNTHAAHTDQTPSIKISSGSNPFGEINNHSSRKNGRSVEEKPAIILKDVVKTYENAAGKFEALKGINLQFEQGQFISIVGKSGCGKSTLLNMITGIDHPTSGKVIVNGEDIYKKSESQRALWRGRNMGVVFQFFQLLPTLTLLENIMLPMDYCQVYNFRERPKRAMELLRMVGLEEQAHKLPGNVSSGQQQSAAIARALATDPPIILADEPTGNLDTRSADTILNLFESLAKEGKTILIVTHDPSLTKRTDKTIILSDGEVIDPTVVQALPFLDHPQMLTATQKSHIETYAPGSTVLQQGQPVDHFFMVASGEVEILVNSKIPEKRLRRLGSGQFFGEVELTLGGEALAGARTTSKGPAKIARISKAEFLRLLQSSPPMKQAIDQVAQIRLNETQALLQNQY